MACQGMPGYVIRLCGYAISSNPWGHIREHLGYIGAILGAYQGHKLYVMRYPWCIRGMHGYSRCVSGACQWRDKGKAGVYQGHASGVTRVQRVCIRGMPVA